MNQVSRQFINRALKFIGFWLVFGILLYLIGHFIHLFLPFVLAFILTLMVNPLRNVFVRRLHLPLAVSTILAMVMEVGSLGAVVTVLVFKIIQEFHDIYAHWPFYSGVWQHILEHWLDKVEVVYLQLPLSYTDAINSAVAGSANSMRNILSGMLSRGVSMAVTIPEMVIVIVISLVATYFMANNSQRYLKELVRVFPLEWRESLIDLGRDFSRAFTGFVKAEFIVFLITMGLSIIGLVVLQARYAIIIGTITGIFGILPVLGVGIILIPWALFAFVAGHTLFAIELVLLTGIISVMRHVIEPKILGDNVGLDPLLVLMSMYIGLAATGAIGLILGPFVLILYRSLQKAGVFRNL